MTNEEFDREFDVLYNSINSNVAPSIDLYEKSVLLTQAQEAIVISLYSGSFEKSEQLRRTLDSLIVTANPTVTTGSPTLSPNSKIYDLSGLPNKVLFITYEHLLTTDACGNTKDVVVVPVTQDEYYKISKNPFKGANEDRALRLDYGDDKVEIISTYPTYEYSIRYLKKPNPIILYNPPTLPNPDTTLTINGEYRYTPCGLDEAIHRSILEKAVEIASTVYKQN